MIGYITLGSNDLDAAKAFFDTLLKPLGGKRAYTLDHMVAYGFGPKRPMLILTKPHDGAQASVGNGTMVALMAQDKSQVDRVHALALSLGAANEGPVGPRGDRFYGGYFRDADGNKFNVFVMP